MSDLPALASLDPGQLERAADPAQFVVDACERAKTWLTLVLAGGSIEQIVELKSQAEAIRVYTVQKNLGKDAELAAQEIVRRAERGIGLAIRQGQAEGVIRKRGDDSRTDLVGHDNLVSPTEFVSKGELYGHRTARRAGLVELVDDVTAEQFEAAIGEAKAEGNLSRANVVRKVLGIAPASPRSEFNRKRRHIDPERIVEQTILTLDGLATVLSLVDVAEVDRATCREWAARMTAALRPVNRFRRRLNER